MDSHKKVSKKDNDYESRIMSLGEVNEETTNEIMELILETNLDDKNISLTKRKPIQIIINSPGGCVYSGLGLIDCITNSETPIHTICYGRAMSMAFAILIAGHKRMASKYSTLMYHELSWESDNQKLNTHAQDLRESKRIMNLYDNYVISRTKLTSKILNPIKDKNKDWYLTAAEAIKYEIIDIII